LGDKIHLYHIRTVWTGKSTGGNSDVKTYNRGHHIYNFGKPDLELTTDNKLVGEPHKLNPEDLLVSSISSCHMLSYLYICSINNIVILDYTDNATGEMEENSNGGGKFNYVTLNPTILVQNETMIEGAFEMHHEAHRICYIANSVNFEVHIKPIITSLT